MQSAEEEAPPQAPFERFLNDQRVTAWLRLDYYQSSNSLDQQSNLFGGTLQLKALPHVNDLLDGKVEVRLTDPDIRNRPGYGPESELLEGYVTMHFGHADLRLGKQIVAWGRADGINPTDNLTPRNYLVLLPWEEDQRFGTWAMRLDTYLSQALTLTVFVSPFFEPHQFALPTDGLRVETHRPGHSAQDTQAGFRLNKVSGELDWSVSYYHGYSLLPAVSEAGAVFQLAYDRIDVLGADLARNFGRFGFRSELAYTLPEDRLSTDPNATRHRLFWVAGIDRTFLEELNVNLQGFVRWMPHYQDPDTLANLFTRNVGILNGIVDAQEARISPGMTFRVSNQWFHETLRAEILALASFRRGDHYVRPLTTYDVSDHIRVLVGANLYGGPRATAYGMLRPDNGVFAELRYGF